MSTEVLVCEAHSHGPGSTSFFEYRIVHKGAAKSQDLSIKVVCEAYSLSTQVVRKAPSSKTGRNFTCQLLMPTFRELLHLPASHTNCSRITSLPASPANFSRELLHLPTLPANVPKPKSYFACQLLAPVFQELLHLPASHANFSRVTSPASPLFFRATRCLPP